jgi:hypothetical protein
LSAKQRERHDLAGEGLGGRHADLRPGVQVDAAVVLAGDRRAHHVHEAERRGAARLASRIAASVSAVSPDCEITMHSVRSVTIGLRSGTPRRTRPRPGCARVLDQVSPISAECQLVPQAVMTMLSMASSSCAHVEPPSFDVPSSRTSRPRIVFSTVAAARRSP